MGESALYAVVRFIEDLDRREPKNVGVVLASAAGIVPRFVERDDLGAQNEVVQRFEGLLDHIIRESMRGGADPFAVLTDIASRRFSHFEIDEPKPTTVDDAPEAMLGRLTDRLVAPADRLIHS
jgi:hypothetical protein